MKISDAAITELKLRHPCCDVAAQWVKLRKKGKKYIGPCPLHSRDRNAKDSTSFECDADGWRCAVCQNGGDVIKLVALFHGLDPRADFRAAVDLLGGVTEPSPERAAELEKERALRAEQREKEANEYREKERRRAFGIWHAAEAWPGSPVETYLREARGLTVLPPLAPRALRYAPVVAYFDGEETNETGRKAPRVVHRGPAMLAPIVDAAGVFRGVHVTWIDLAQPKGKALIRDPQTGEVLKSKKSYGSVAGNYIPLVEAPALAPDAPADLTGYGGEGIETALSVWAGLTLAGRDLSRAWFRSTISLGNLSGRSAESVRHPTEKDAGGRRALRVPGPQPDLDAKAFPLPVGTSDVVLLGDGDSDPFRTACALHCGSKRLEARGVSARVAMAPAGEDFNDRARAGDFAGIVGLVDAAAPIADPTASAEAPIAASAEAEPPAEPVAAAPIAAAGSAESIADSAAAAAPADTGRESGIEGAKIAAPPSAAAPEKAGKQETYGIDADNVVAFPGGGKRKSKKKKGKRSGNDAAPAADNGAEEPQREPRSFGFSIERMNERFAVAILGSKAVIYVQTPDAPVKDRKRFISTNAFHTWHANRIVEYLSGDTIRVTTWSEAWMRSFKRREYFGVEFSPPDNGGNPVATENYLNLWSGFAYTPAARPDPKRYKTFRDHLLNNVAGGDEVLFRWVFAFLARIVQRPRERVGVALVLRGRMGSGKTKVGEVIGKLIPEHWFLADDARYITGNFNVHMATCLLLQADEAVWAGDKAAEGRLKGLITSPSQAIEAKGIDPIWVDNFVTLILTSNEDWVVPAGKDERRFAVLDVGPRCAQNTSYFAEMDRELENGGFEHLLGALLRFPIDSVNLRQIPRTAALLEQKIRSLDSIESWWFARLHAGAPLRRLSEWKTEIPTNDLFEDYIAASEKIGIKRKQEETIFGMKLKRLVPSRRTARRRMMLDDGHGLKSGRVHVALLPDLQTARAEFEALVQQAIDWPADDADDNDEAAASRAREDDVVPL
jgi:hypothetical protein